MQSVVEFRILQVSRERSYSPRVEGIDVVIVVASGVDDSVELAVGAGAIVLGEFDADGDVGAAVEVGAFAVDSDAAVIK